jgi:hypothetical protein
MNANNYHLNETTSSAKERLGKFARFLVWNGTIYAIESSDPLAVAPAQQSSSYTKHQILFDSIITELKYKSPGAWVYVRERRQWYCLPLSVVERRAIATFDASVMDYLPINLPKQPVYPL